jgi:hypothetical protein
LKRQLSVPVSMMWARLVNQVSITFQQQNASSPALDGTYTWSIANSQLGSTPPITPPTSSTDVPPGTLPPNTPGQNTRGSGLPFSKIDKPLTGKHEIRGR